MTKIRLSRSEKKELVQQLRTFRMFAECTPDDLSALVEAGRPFTMPAYWAIMAEGDAAGSFYAITRGHARVFHGRRQIAEVGPGEVVGEMSVLSGRPRRATVTSTERMAGLRVATDEMTELFAHHPRLLDALRRTYEQRLANDPESSPADRHRPRPTPAR
jgi:CRP-like cAMP-binding protein